MGKNGTPATIQTMTTKTAEPTEPIELTAFDLLIMKTDVDAIMHERIRDQIQMLRPNKSDIIVIVLETPGGIPMYAYRTMRLLGSMYKKVYSIIPDMSMSAGTLMALGADSIGMLADSCLGPLDLQIEHPDDDKMISTLDVRDTASSTSLEASAVARKIFLDNRNSGMPKRMSERLAVNIATAMYGPIMDKIDPYRMHESVRNAEVGEKYAVRLLSSRMMVNQRHQACRISNILANSYSYHGYAITPDEAVELGLSIFACEKMKAWSVIYEFYQSAEEGDIISKSILNNGTKENKDA